MMLFDTSAICCLISLQILSDLLNFVSPFPVDVIVSAVYTPVTDGGERETEPYGGVEYLATVLPD